MTTPDYTPATARVRVADFCSARLSLTDVLPVNSSDVSETVAHLRKYADLPYVYLLTGDQRPFVHKVLAQLAAIRSTCYPHALFILNPVDGGPQADPDDPCPELQVFELQDTNADAIGERITAFAGTIQDFDHDYLKFSQARPLPRTVDVMVVGAGLVGLYAARRLKAQGLSFCVADQREQVGGIWSKYANSTSQVNSSEGAYRLVEQARRNNRDHSFTREVLADIAAVAREVADDLYTNSRVERIRKTADGYETDLTRNSEKVTVRSKGVLLAVNDRVGEPRVITWPEQDRFQGTITTGISDETRDIQWRGKKVVIIGMGAFAIENARTALEAGAEQVTVVCRRHGTVCPKIIDYLNFATPYDEHFQHPNKSNMRNMLLWKNLYKKSGATQPECWMGKIKHTGHTISVSDIWFIAHHLGKLHTLTGTVTGMFDKGVVVNDGQQVQADIVVNCVGFYRNADHISKLCDYTETYNINYLDKDFMYLADAYIDDDAFNSFFGSSVLEMARFYMEIFVRYFDSPDFNTMIQTPGIEKLPIETRAWSHYIAGATALIDHYDELRRMARKQVDERTGNFLEAHDLQTYIAQNRREWIDTHSLLAGKPVPEEQCLPYVFDKLLDDPKTGRQDI